MLPQQAAQGRLLRPGGKARRLPDELLHLIVMLLYRVGPGGLGVCLCLLGQCLQLAEQQRGGLQGLARGIQRHATARHLPGQLVELVVQLGQLPVRLGIRPSRHGGFHCTPDGVGSLAQRGLVVR